MLVLTTRRALVGFKSFPAIGRAIHRSLHDIDDISVLRINEDAAEISAAHDARIGRRLLPTRAAVIRAKESLIHNRIDAIAAIARCDHDADSSARLLRQSCAIHRLPRRALVCGLEYLRLSLLFVRVEP